MNAAKPTPSASSPANDVLSLDSWSASSGNDRPSRARLILSGGGRRWRAHAQGNGAVDALLAAADEALAPLLGAGVRLLSYEVHAAAAGHETAALITVEIAAHDSPQITHPGSARHENVLHASIAAYLAAINHYLAASSVDVAALAPAPGQTNVHATESEQETRSMAQRAINARYNR